MMKVSQPGRAVVFLDGRFSRAQFYRLDEEHIVPMLLSGSGPEAALSGKELELAERAIRETDGKISREVLTGWGLGFKDAARIMDRWSARGWAEKDPQRANATYITQILRDLLHNRTTRTTQHNPGTARTAGRTTRTTGSLAPGMA